jgi:RNA polymerase sigma-70 factor, ECF subfamily
MYELEPAAYNRRRSSVQVMGMFEDEIAAPLPVVSGELERSALEEEVIALFDRFQDRLLRYLMSLGLDAADGEEVVQEVFLALFQHLRRGKSRRNLRAWIFQVAHNLGLKRRERLRRDRQALAECAALDREAHCADPAPNPEDRLAGNQRLQRLWTVLRALPERDQRCLALRAEGLTYREIAEVLGISLGAVSLSLARSLARLTRADSLY